MLPNKAEVRTFVVLMAQSSCPAQSVPVDHEFVERSARPSLGGVTLRVPEREQRVRDELRVEPQRLD